MHPDYDRFFVPLAGSLEAFAEQNRLRIEKYYHDAPTWSLLFRHPKGGVAKVEVTKNTETQVGIGGIWWIDDYDAGTRSLRVFETKLLPVEEAAVVQCATEALRDILSHDVGSWSQVATGLKPLWHMQPRSFIEDYVKLYDYPKNRE